MAAGKKKALLLLRQPDLTKASWTGTRGKSLQHVAHSSTRALVRSPAASCSILPIPPIHLPSQLLLQALWQKRSHVPLCACSQLCQSREKNTMRLFFRGLGFLSSYFNYKWKRNSLLWDYFSKISQGAFPARHHSLHSSLQSLPYITTECSPHQIIHEKHPMGEI